MDCRETLERKMICRQPRLATKIKILILNNNLIKQQRAILPEIQGALHLHRGNTSWLLQLGKTLSKLQMQIEYIRNSKLSSMQSVVIFSYHLYNNFIYQNTCNLYFLKTEIYLKTFWINIRMGKSDPLFQPCWYLYVL